MRERNAPDAAVWPLLCALRAMAIGSFERWVATACATAALACSSGGHELAARGAGGDAGADGAACPTDLAGWKPYRDRLTAALSQNLGEDTNGDSYGFVQRCLAAIPDADAATQARTCVSRVLDFLIAEAPGPGKSALGFTVSDADYYAQTSSITALPPELVANEFTSKLAAWDDTRAIAAYLDGLNTRRAAQNLPRLEWLTYQTLLATPDAAQTSGRLLVVYPDPQRHRTVWTQFGLVPPSAGTFSSHVFSVTILEPEAGPAQIYFHRYEKVRGADGTLSVTNSTDATPLDHCGSCHKSGLLVLDPTQVDAQYQSTADRLQKLVIGYGATSSPFEQSPHRGPGLGTPGPRTPDFFENCAAEAIHDTAVAQKAEVLSKLKSAMDCVSCHDGSYRGRLSSLLNPVVVTKYYWSGLMPPGYETKLTALERDSVMTCLVSEYFGVSPEYDGVLTEYLRAPQCP
jgi:hypothetical protein